MSFLELVLNRVENDAIRSIGLKIMLYDRLQIDWYLAGIVPESRCDINLFGTSFYSLYGPVTIQLLRDRVEKESEVERCNVDFQLELLNRQ